MSFVEFHDVKKIYHMGEVEIPALQGVNFRNRKRRILRDRRSQRRWQDNDPEYPWRNGYADGGKGPAGWKRNFLLRKEAADRLPRYDIGFVFQFYNLVGNLTALENVELASQICSDPLDAGQVLADVGLADRASNFPAQLSGGEQQRVAIARALAKNPKLLLCDEPTGALDYNTGKAVLKLLQDTCRKKGVTVVVITHNQAITAMADRIITVKNGTVTDMRKNEHIVPVEQIEW